MNVAKGKDVHQKDIGGVMYKKCIEILNELEQNGYITIWNEFSFPQPVPLKLRLKDMLEKDVEEKYYLSDKMVTFLVKNNDKQKGRGNGFTFTAQKSNEADVANCIKPQCGSKMTDTFIEEATAFDEQNKYIRNDGCIGTITTDGSSPKHNNRIIEPMICASRGRYTEQGTTEQQLELNKEGTANTITTVEKDNYVLEPQSEPDVKLVGRVNGDHREGYHVNDAEAIASTVKAQNTCHTWYKVEEKTHPQYRIRKLTPRECFRLMGFKDEQFDKIKDVSNAQLYKQAGNSIVVNVLEAIFRQLFLADHTGQKQIEHTKTFKQMDLF